MIIIILINRMKNYFKSCLSCKSCLKNFPPQLAEKFGTSGLTLLNNGTRFSRRLWQDLFQ